MSWKKVHLSIDLVEAAFEHRQFLQLVNACPSLYAGPHVQNAIRRYLHEFFEWMYIESLHTSKVHLRRQVLFRSSYFFKSNDCLRSQLAGGGGGGGISE